MGDIVVWDYDIPMELAIALLTEGHFQSINWEGPDINHEKTRADALEKPGIHLFVGMAEPINVAEEGTPIVQDIPISPNGEDELPPEV